MPTIVPQYLDRKIFAGMPVSEIAPTPEDIAGFNAWLAQYRACLPVEEAAVRCK